MNDKAETLAASFYSALADTLGPVLFTSMRKRNRAHVDAGRTGFCASHDFCDANQVMLDAFAYVMQRDADTASDDDMRLMNEAWTLAKARYLTA